MSSLSLSRTKSKSNGYTQLHTHTYLPPTSSEMNGQICSAAGTIYLSIQFTRGWTEGRCVFRKFDAVCSKYSLDLVQENDKDPD